jgi:twitching motility protein PilJ
MFMNLRIWHKAVLIAVAFSLPIVVLLYLLVNEQSKTIDFAEEERKGLEYLKPTSKLLSDLLLHRDLAAAHLGGDAAYKDQVTKKQADIDADFNALDREERRFGAAFKTSKEYAALKKSWADLKAGVLTLKPEQSLEQHNKLINEALRLIVRAGNSSNLVLDPDVASYYAMDAVIFKVPDLMEEISNARGFGASAIAKGGELSATDKALLASARARILESAQKLKDNIEFGLEANPKMSATLKPAVEYTLTSTNAFLDQLDKKVLAAQAPQMTTAEYFAEASKAVDVSSKLSDSSAAVLDDLLVARIGHSNQSRLISLVAVGVSLLITTLLLVLIVRSITRPINHLSQVAERISLGEMDAKIDIATREDIGDLARKFRRLQVSLKQAMDQLEGREDENT